MRAKEYITSHPNVKGPDRDPLYRDGQRVQLEQIDDEPCEEGTILYVDWDIDYYRYGIELDDKFLEGPGDDGLRECGEDQIVKVLDLDG